MSKITHSLKCETAIALSLALILEPFVWSYAWASNDKPNTPGLYSEDDSSKRTPSRNSPQSSMPPALEVTSSDKSEKSEKKESIANLATDDDLKENSPPPLDELPPLEDYEDTPSLTPSPSEENSRDIDISNNALSKQRVSGSTKEKDNELASSLTKPQPKYVVRSLEDLYYTDVDISEYIESALKSHADFTYAEGCKYLLTGSRDGFAPIHDTEDGRAYIVAVTPGVDTAGKSYKQDFFEGFDVSSLNIDYYLDKSTHPDEKEELLQKIVTSVSKDASYETLLAELERIKKNRKLEFIDDVLEQEGENVANILTRFQKDLEAIKADQKDVFDELMPLLLKSNLSHVKILFPYNTTQVHWLTGEIRIHKEEERYTIEILAHNPMGGGEMDEANFMALERALKKRIGEYHPTAKFPSIERKKSSYSRRQAKGDFISCGIIEAEDILNRITGPIIKLSKEACYPLGVEELRRQHIEVVKQNDKRLKFIERNEEKLKFLKENRQTFIDPSEFSLSSGKRVFSLPAKKETNENLALDHKQIETFSNILTSIEQPDLKSCIMEALKNSELYKAWDGSYLVGLQTAIYQKPFELSTQGIELSKEDIRRINFLYGFLLHPEGLIKGTN
jgi:hypothetical protein